MNKVKIHFIIKGFEDVITFEYDDPSEVEPMFIQWLEKRNLKLEDLEDYWGEKN